MYSSSRLINWNLNKDLQSQYDALKEHSQMAESAQDAKTWELKNLSSKLSSLETTLSDE